MNATPRVAVVGAGFAGLSAARRLAWRGFRVTIIDQHNYHAFQPLLYQVSTAGLNPADIAYPVRGLFQKSPNVLFKQGKVVGVDWVRREVDLVGEDPVAFDYLILAAGSATNYFGVPGADDYAFPLYTLSDSLRLRNHLLSLFEAADSIRGLVEDGVLNFVVVGGGPTGIEVAGAMAELIQKVLRKDYHDLDVTAARVILVERGDALLAAFSGKSQEHSIEALRKRGVEVRLETAVHQIAPDHVVLSDGQTIPTRLVVWAAGVKASAVAGQGGWEQGPGGRITVNPDLTVPGDPSVFAVGDVADIADGNGGRLPQLAQVALQSGKFAADQIIRTESGEERQQFRYRNKGIMATIGRHSAVAEMSRGPKLTGVTAWLAVPAPHVPGRPAQPVLGDAQLGLELRDLGLRSAIDPRPRGTAAEPADPPGRVRPDPLARQGARSLTLTVVGGTSWRSRDRSSSPRAGSTPCAVPGRSCRCPT